MALNFNRIIELELASQNDSFKISCPAKGRKPDIEISGVMDQSDQVSNFEVRIKNLYTDKILADYQTIKVTAGYEGNLSTSIIGSVMNVYTSEPAPDKVTVIQCLQSQLTSYLNKTVSLSLKAGFTLEEALRQISTALEFNAPQVDSSITKTAAAPLQTSGLAKDVLHSLRSYWPDVVIVVDNNKLKATPNDRGTSKIFNINYVTSAPQFSGNLITLTCPWVPDLKPRDYINIKTNFYEKDNTLNATDVKSKYLVNSISFTFGTINSNTMTIEAIA